MRHLIENSLRFYFNDELMCYEFCTITNKFKVREILDDGFCLYSLIRFVNDNDKRPRIKRLSLVDSIIRYKMGINLCNDIIIEYKDGNYKNLSIDNIVIKSIYDYCDRWVFPIQFNNRYRLSSSGLVYDCEKHCLVKYEESGNYFMLCHHFVHRLVWEYFGDSPLSENKVVDHINNNMYDNDINNLQLVSQNINIRKERNRFSDKYNIMISFNGKRYYLGKRQYHTYEESEQIYHTALSYVENGTIDNYFCDHDYIRYDFLHCKWKVISLPNKKEIIFDNDLLFDSYNECEEYFNEMLQKYNLRYIPIGSKEYYLHRNIIRFRYNNKMYKFPLLRNNKEFSEKVIDLYFQLDKESFINEMDILSKEREFLKTTKVLPSSPIKVKDLVPTENNIINNDIEFNSRPNYTFNTYNENYVFNIPFNGQYYLLGSIQNEEMVKEINNTIQEHKNEKDFLILLETYKEIYK